MKDLSQYQNHWSCYNWGTIVSCGSPGQWPQLVQWNKKGLYFDGVDDYIDFSSFSWHTGYPTMTWCAGYSNYLSSGANILFSKGGAYRMMAYNNPQIAISTVNNGWYTTWTYFDLWSWNRITPLSTRIYLCFVYDGAYIRAYRDWKYLNSNWYALSWAVGSAVSSFRMAWKDSANTAFYNGEIDEVRIYNRALSDSEIFDLYK